MKKSKIFASFLLAAAMSVSLMSGCGASRPASPPGSLKPGTYEGIGKGHGGEVKVSVLIGEDGTIKEIGPIAHTESAGYGPRAVDELPGRIISAQSLGVDAVSGATITSRAILEAVADAVAKAGGDPAALGYVPLSEISAADEVTFKGLPNGDVTITGKQLISDYDPVNVDVTSVNASGEKNGMNATGVKLEDILEKLGGVSQKDYKSVVTTATDGYVIEIPEGILKTRDIIIAYEVDGQPQSPRVIIPDERAMYWAKFLCTVELMGENTVDSEPAGEILLLETALAGMTGEDYKYYDSTDKAVAISELLGAYVPAKTDFVTLESIDQWGKNEKYDTFAAQYIKYTGEDAPLFIGPSLPEGMRLKQTLRMRVGNVSIVSAAMGGLAAKTPDALSVQKLFEIAEMKEAGIYIFTAADGYSVEIPAADIAKGSIATGEDGTAAVSFEGLPKNTSVRNLLRIAAKDA